MKLAERIIRHCLDTPTSMLTTELVVAQKIIDKMPWYLAEDALCAIFDVPEDAEKEESEDA